MTESSSSDPLLNLPNWGFAVKAIPVGRALTSGESPEGAEGSFTYFTEAMANLVELHRRYGSSVAMEQIKILVDAFVSKIDEFYARTLAESRGSLLKIADFSCPICFEVVEEPLTMRCGHSYCKKCLLRHDSAALGNQCRLCSYRFISVDLNDTKPNVLLVSIADKLWPYHKHVSSLRNEGNDLVQANKLEEALHKYSQAIEFNPCDHLSLCNRAHIRWMLGEMLASLEDAERAIPCCPFWFKSYFRKAISLDSLGRYEDAFCTLTLCVYIIHVTKSPEDRFVLVKNEMVKVLLKIFSSALTAAKLSVRRRAVESFSFTPYPDQKKGSKRIVDHWSDPDYVCTVGEGEVPRPSGSLKEFSSLHQSRGRTPTTTQGNSEPVATRMHHIFTLAMQEVTAFENKKPNTFREVDVSLISVADFECSLCYRLLYQPVTTTCGHTYCRTCLERCLDHSPTCPLCKASLDSCIAFRRHAVTYSLEHLIVKMFPKEHTDRVNQHLEEVADGAQSGKDKETEIPIFVCTMAFPTIPCLLHVFEPRYRLMIRRCMESGSKQFGMCCYMQDADHNYGDFGTMLEIRNIQYFPDGRSVLNTVGIKRFRVIKKSIKDGYNVATIEYLVDKPLEDLERPRLRDAHERVFKDANDWFQSIDQPIHQRIVTHFGNMPTPEEDWMSVPGGPAWSWWLLAILPLDAKAQLAILSTTSLTKRLDSLQKVLRYVKAKMN